MIEEIKMIYEEAQEAMQGSIKHLETELLKIRAGKANPVMLEGVMVDYYGSPTPIQQVANINTLDARTITVQPWEKSILDDVARGIINANLGLNPQNNGEVIMINIPPLTEERRKELVKRAKAEGENAKIGVRNQRKDANDMIKKLKEENISEDFIKDGEEQIQSLTNKYSNEVDKLVEKKEQDIMTV